MAFGLGEILSLGGMAAGGEGGIEANKRRTERRRDLEATAAVVGGQLAPMKEAILPGLAPGGDIREALAAGGLTRSQQASLDALARAREMGTRTSAGAQEKTFDALVNRVLSSAGVVENADTTANKLLADIGLGEFGFSDIFNLEQIDNPLAGVSAGLKTAGATISSFSPQGGGEEVEV